MNLYSDLEDITKVAYDEDDEEELDLLQLVSTNTTNASQYLLFVGSDEQLYAKSVSKIKELLIYKELQIAKNNRKSLIVGTANIRDEMTTIIHFDEWYGNRVLDDREYELVIVADYGEKNLGIVVKSVEHIVNIPKESMKENTHNNDKSAFICTINIKNSNELCVIIDSDRMFLDVFKN